MPIRNVRHIGQVIAALRRNMNITGEELGRRSSMSQSKISKIETGFYAQPNPAEIRTILNILKAPVTIIQRIEYVLDASTPRHKTQALSLSIAVTKACFDLEQKSQSIKIYVANAIPALLQTLTYRKASLCYKGINNDDLSTLLNNTLLRQDKLWSGRHKFYFLIPQTVLYTVATTKAEHMMQLDRLERAIDIPHVTFGIIPLEAGTILVEYSSFALYDGHTLVQALSKYELTSHDKEEIELHDNVFRSLSDLALYNEDAVRLIRTAIKYFS